MVPQNSRRRLLVEGPDDLHCVIHLMRRHGADWDKPDGSLPFVETRGGFEQLRAGISSSLFKSAEAVGVLVDADTDAIARWASIRDRLRQVEVDLPSAPVRGGWVGQSGMGPRCGVWMMPNNAVPGILEDFLHTLVPVDDPCWTHAESSTVAARALGAPFPTNAHSKAVLHTWLAWQHEPGQPFGQAITATVLRADSDLARAFVDWFRRVFS